MIKIILPAILILGLISCNAEKVKQENKNPLSLKIDQNEQSDFDLTQVNLNENIDTLLASQGIKFSTEKNNEPTILGLDTYVSTSERLLKFNGVSMSGKSSAKINQIIIHYNSTDHKIEMYELKVFNKQPANQLLSSLNHLFGKPSFEKSDTNPGSIALDENGDEVKSSAGTKNIYKVWEDDKTGNSYILIQTHAANGVSVELTTLNRKSRFANDWISFRAFDWYKK